jgi:Copper transport outer membrane protein, MctB
LFSFRYHAMSLGAIFLALGIGVLLGVAIGENGVVSDASKDLEQSLRGDLNGARSRNADLRREIAVRDDYEAQTYEPLVRDLLPGWRVGIVAMGKLPGGYAADVADAIEPAGASLDSVSVIKAPLPLGRLASEMKGTKLARLDRSDDQLERFGRRMGRQLVNGGDLVDRLRHELFSSSRGEYRGLDAVVYVRRRDGLEGDERSAQDRFESALLTAIGDSKRGLVGAETTGTDPSQVGFMSSKGIASVDDLDLTAGKTALVWVLAGDADGRYGVKASAEHLLPKAPDEGAARRP